MVPERQLYNSTREDRLMPMIDVYAPTGLLPAERRRDLTAGLTAALIGAEGHDVVDPYASNTAAFVHELPADCLATATSDAASAVRVQVVTPPGALDREGQRTFVAEATRLVAEIAGDPGLKARTWVILTEAAEGGWGLFGTAFGREEFAALAGKAG
jgi:phenylpyruvate tautomerase PptA (4-oxalocrotonate tautomerase family)